jgi:hypothetical protein
VQVRKLLIYFSLVWLLVLMSGIGAHWFYVQLLHDPQFAATVTGKHQWLYGAVSSAQRQHEIATMEHISKDPIIGKPFHGNSFMVAKSLTALDECRARVHALGGGFCELEPPAPGLFVLYPNEAVPPEPQDAKICIVGKTCPK